MKSNYKLFETWGEDVWACGFQLSENKAKLTALQDPVKGKIKKRKFYKYLKDGSLSANGVSVNSRMFTKTENEAIDLFNYLIEEEKRLLNERAKELSQYMIKKSLSL